MKELSLHVRGWHSLQLDCHLAADMHRRFVLLVSSLVGFGAFSNAAVFRRFDTIPNHHAATINPLVNSANLSLATVFSNKVLNSTADTSDFLTTGATISSPSNTSFGDGENSFNYNLTSSSLLQASDLSLASHFNQSSLPLNDTLKNKAASRLAAFQPLEIKYQGFRFSGAIDRAADLGPLASLALQDGVDEIIADIGLLLTAATKDLKVIPGEARFAAFSGRVCVQLVFPKWDPESEGPSPGEAGEGWSVALANRGLVRFSEALPTYVARSQVNPIAVNMYRETPWSVCRFLFSIANIESETTTVLLTPTSGHTFAYTYVHPGLGFGDLNADDAQKAIQQCIREARERGELVMYEPEFCMVNQAAFSYYVKRRNEKPGLKRGLQPYFLERLTDTVINYVLSTMKAKYTGFDAVYETDGMLIQFAMGKVELGQTNPALGSPGTVEVLEQRPARV